MATDVKEAAAEIEIDANISSPGYANQAITHPVFSRLISLEAVRIFMHHHVWCVWDFMYLAKAVQSGLGGRGAWTPSAHPEALARINDILSTEETDVGPRGLRGSHFEFFIEAMEAAGADTGSVLEFREKIELGQPPLIAMRSSGASSSAMEFVGTTLEHALGAVHVRAASFCVARENLVPHMLKSLRRYVPWACRELEMFKWYVDRHIELDAADHGPASQQILAAVIGRDASRRNEAQGAADMAVAARVKYLDAILGLL